tara:strand:+ start:1843 stop:2316 length:474 start_codon:yes stop_codon:yes gene_type:complete
MSVDTNKDADNNGPTQDFVTMTVAGQAFGIPVLHVRDVLGPQRITRVPLAPPEIEGSLNLRGRIVTAVNMRQRLQLAKSDCPEKAMAVVVEYEDEPYSLLVDEVGEVLRLSDRQRDNNPATLDAKWRQIADGLYRLDGSLLIVLNIAAVLGAIRAEA